MKAHLATLVATIAIGVAGAIYILPTLGRTAVRGEQVRNLSSAKQLGVALQAYASEHEGQFPLHLTVLIPDFVEGDKFDELLFLAKVADEWPPRLKYDWLYFGAFLSEKQPPALLLASPRAFRDDKRQKRIVLRRDFTAQVINDNEYQVELRKMIEAMRRRAGRLTSPPTCARSGRAMTRLQNQG